MNTTLTAQVTNSPKMIEAIELDALAILVEAFGEAVRDDIDDMEFLPELEATFFYGDDGQVLYSVNFVTDEISHS